MRKLLFVISDFCIKKSPFIVGPLIFLALIFTIFKPESSNFSWIELLIGFLLITSSTLGLIVFWASKQKIPKTLFYFFIFVSWTVFTIFLSLNNDVSFIFWARKFFPILIFPVIAISTMSIFKTPKQMTFIYISLFVVATIAFLKSFLPILFIDISMITRCDIFRDYSGWDNGLLIFSLAVPIILHNKISHKFLKMILYFIVCLSIFSLVISLTRTYWVGAIVSILFTSFLLAQSAGIYFFRNFLIYIIKIFIGISIIAILTYTVFPGNIQYCFLNRIDSLVNLFKDPAVLERVSESKGALNSLTQVLPSEVERTSNNSIRTTLNILVGNGLGSKFTYNSVVTGKEFYVKSDFSHNYFIYLLWTTGIIGLFLFILASWELFLQIRRNIFHFYVNKEMLIYLIGISSTLIVVFVISFVGSPLFLYESAVYYGIIFGLGLGIINLNKNNEKRKVVIVHNIVSPYKVYLFNALNSILKDFEVIFIAKSEKIRSWDFGNNEFKFKYQILFDGNIEDIDNFKQGFKIIKKLNEIRPDVVIIDGYSYFYCWVAMFWGKLKNKKLIFWSSSTYYDQKKYFYKELIKIFFVKMFDSANTYSTKSKKYLEKLGFKSSKISVIGNITDNRYYQELSNQYKLTSEDIKLKYNLPKHNFLYVGRFSPEKNILGLLESFKNLVLSGVKGDWGLVLVGSGPQENEVINFIQKFNLINDVKMVGFHQKKEICSFYSVCDVLIVPSLSETWGLVVNEAMSCGLAVIVSKNCGCYPDIVKDGQNGFSFNPEDISGLKDLLAMFVYGEVDLDSMKASSLKIIQDYTPEKAAVIIKKTIEML